MNEPPIGRVLAWDSDFWGVQVARIAPVIGGSADEAVATADRWCREHDVDVAFLSVPSEQVELLGSACRSGFEVQSIEVVLERSIEGGAEVAGVRPARAADAAPLEQFAGEDLRGKTRFYRDPSFPDGRCDELYRTWMRRSLEGWADDVLVDERDGVPAGGITIHGATDERSASIGLLVLGDGTPWQRVATAGRLLRAGFAHLGRAGASSVTLSTQAHNGATLRLLQAHDCVVRSINAELHRWTGSGRP
ncbi:MAG: hypothetical protein ACTHN0_04365 [Aquihabitans sp.]